MFVEASYDPGVELHPVVNFRHQAEPLEWCAGVSNFGKSAALWYSMRRLLGMAYCLTA
jgi:hypothetical protein